eukprot:6491445-Prymnesium_polylepis.1
MAGARRRFLPPSPVCRGRGSRVVCLVAGLSQPHAHVSHPAAGRPGRRGRSSPPSSLPRGPRPGTMRGP